MGLSNNTTFRKWIIEDETSGHILCECEALNSLRYAYVGYFFFDPEGIMNLSIGAIWKYGKGTGLR